jgi:motility quorum-sensing regulator/GCU-specific mRNA interferase toxin
MTEKPKPHYDLEELKELVGNNATRYITRPSVTGGFALDFSVTEIVEVIQSLEDTDFYKTMPSEWNDKLWQDVYKPTAKGVSLYVKIQKSLDSKCVVISFKRK